MKDWLGIPLVFDAGSQPSAPRAGLQRGIVGYWPFDGNANDATEYCNNGTLHNVTQTEDRYGNANKAYRFSGSGYIEVPHSNILNMKNAITMTAWIRPHNWYKGWVIIMQKGDKRNANYQFALYLPNQQVHLYTPYRLGGQCGQLGLELLNKWQQIALTYESGKSLCFYRNGVKIGTWKFDKVLQPNNGSLFIGYDPFWGTEYFIGDMDDVRIFNRALSAEEIQELYKVESSNVKLPYEVVDDEKRNQLGTVPAKPL